MKQLLIANKHLGETTELNSSKGDEFTKFYSKAEFEQGVAAAINTTDETTNSHVSVGINLRYPENLPGTTNNSTKLEDLSESP